MIGVGDREFGRHGDLLLAVLADPERRDREGGEVAGEVVEEAAKLGGLRVGRERLEAVDHHDPRTALLDQRSHLLEDAGEAALVERPGRDPRRRRSWPTASGSKKRRLWP